MCTYPFGERLRGLREERGLKRSDLASLLGCTEQKIGHLETGARGIGMTDAAKLAKIFDMTLSELVPIDDNGEFVTPPKPEVEVA